MQPPVGEALYLARMWGTRNVAIGALTLTAKGRDARRSAFMLGAAMNAVDAALALATPGLSSKTRTQGALTSGAFGAMALYALRES